MGNKDMSANTLSLFLKRFSLKVCFSLGLHHLGTSLEQMFFLYVLSAPLTSATDFAQLPQLGACPLALGAAAPFASVALTSLLRARLPVGQCACAHGMRLCARAHGMRLCMRTRYGVLCMRAWNEAVRACE